MADFFRWNLVATLISVIFLIQFKRVYFVEYCPRVYTYRALLLNIHTRHLGALDNKFLPILHPGLAHSLAHLSHNHRAPRPLAIRLRRRPMAFSPASSPHLVPCSSARQRDYISPPPRHVSIAVDARRTSEITLIKGWRREGQVVRPLPSRLGLKNDPAVTLKLPTGIHARIVLLPTYRYTIP